MKPRSPLSKSATAFQVSTTLPPWRPTRTSLAGGGGVSSPAAPVFTYSIQVFATFSLGSQPASWAFPAKDDAAAPSFATLARHADELYAAHRWSEAAAAYRDLVRRWPDVAPAKRWRTRLAEAQAESARTSAPAAAPAEAK